MRKDWFFPRSLAKRLAEGRVSNREVAYLTLANLLFSSFIFYGAFTWANPPWTLLSLLEATVVVVVTIIGFTRSYFAGGGDANEHFARNFNCLSFGAWCWSTLIVWSVYWLVVWLFQTGMFAAYRFENLGLAQNLAAIGGSFGWLWTLLAAVFWQALFFVFLQPGLQKARSAA